jgi:signal transduction histidine kinase/ActR/RegA family two-component response regulator
MKKIYLIMFFIIINFFIFNSYIYASSSKIYKSATEYDYPPFSVTDNGVADGFSVDLLKAVAYEMDLKIVFKIDKWDTIKNELEKGKLDVLPLVGRTEEREKIFDFTIPYIVMHGNIFVRNENTSIKTENDLKGKEIIVMNGDNACEYAQKKKFTDKLIIVNTYTEAFKLLSSGKHDVILAQSIVGLKLINDLKIKNIKAVAQLNKDVVKIAKLNLSDFEQKFCFAVTEGNRELLEKLNEGLVIISENGKYQEIYNKWFPFLIDSTVQTGQIITNVIVIIIPIIIIFLIVSVILIKKEVNKKTFDLEKINRELNIEKDKAEAANIAKSQFLANMSHEIRTPMNGLLGMIQLLEMSNLTKDQKEFIKIIRTSSDLLLNVINDILDHSKIEAGMLILEKLPFNVSKVLDDVIALFELSSKKKNLVIESYVDEAVPINVVGDSFRFKQILSNLLGNAIKFTNRGKITININKIEEVGDNKFKLEIRVKDTGIGIPNNKIKLLFSSFSQIDSSNTRNYGGTGLGLSICKGLVEKMGGEINVESKEGEGSCFYFTCIMSYDDKVNFLPKILKTDKVLSIDNYKTSNKIKLLLAEDDEISRIVVEKLLLHIGWEVIFAHNGKQAIDLYNKNSFDAIIMDVQMPVIDGYKATEVIRQLDTINNKHTPIIGMTAYALQGDREKCLEAGMNDYLTKPINSELFYKTIEKWIKHTNAK